MNMLRYRKGERLDDWLRAVRDSHIKELLSFVRGIERDKAAVLAGLTLPHSNGIGDRQSEQAAASLNGWDLAEQDFHCCANGCFTLFNQEKELWYNIADILRLRGEPGH